MSFGPVLTASFVYFAMSVTYYGVFLWLPGILIDRGADIVESGLYSIAIFAAALPAVPVAARVMQRWGRRAALTAFLLAYAASVAGFALIDTFAVAVFGAAMAFANGLAWNTVYVYVAETLPSDRRGTGLGIAYSAGRVGAIAAPVVTGHVYAATNTHAAALGLYAVLVACAAAIVFGRKGLTR